MYVSYAFEKASTLNTKFFMCQVWYMRTEMEMDCLESSVKFFNHLVPRTLFSVFFSVCTQPSQIKFSCLPVSRVECMLKLPSLDLVFSSNRGELETLGTTCPAETLSPGGGAAAQGGAKASASKAGTPGETRSSSRWREATDGLKRFGHDIGLSE